MQTDSYALFSSDQSSNIELLCIDPKVVFKSILEEEPYKMVFTSATLGNKNYTSKKLGVEFQENQLEFKLENSEL